MRVIVVSLRLFADHNGFVWTWPGVGTGQFGRPHNLTVDPSGFRAQKSPLQVS